MRRWALLAFLHFLAVSLCGCSGGKPAAKYRIAVIPKGVSHEFWQSIDRGAKRAQADLEARGLAVEVNWDGPLTEDDAAAQISTVQKHFGTGVSGIVLAPQHSKTMIDVVRQTVDNHVPVVIIDSGLDKPDLYVKYVATDNYHGGQLGAQRLIQVCQEAGKPAPKLILLRYAVGSESTEKREQGFLDYINLHNETCKAAGKPTVTLLSSDQHAGATAASAREKADPLLTQFQDQVDGIFAPNESATTGVLQALRSKELAKKVRLVGFDSSEPLVQAVRAGDVDGLIVQDPYRMGYLGVWVMLQYLEGYDVAADGKNLSTGEYVLTKENVDSAEIQGLFKPEAQQARTIQVPEFTKKR